MLQFQGNLKANHLLQQDENMHWVRLDVTQTIGVITSQEFGCLLFTGRGSWWRGSVRGLRRPSWPSSSPDGWRCVLGRMLPRSYKRLFLRAVQAGHWVGWRRSGWSERWKPGGSRTPAGRGESHRLRWWRPCHSPAGACGSETNGKFTQESWELIIRHTVWSARSDKQIQQKSNNGS